MAESTLLFYFTSILSGIFIFLIFRFILIKLERFIKGLPVNGPVGLPFVGCMWSNNYLSYVGIEYIHDEQVLMKYGTQSDVFTVRCGEKDIVIFNNLDLYKDITRNNKKTFDWIMQDWSGLHWGNTQSFMFANNNWHKRRKIVHEYLITQHKKNYIQKKFNKYLDILILPRLDDAINNNQGIWDSIKPDLSSTLFNISAELTFCEDIDLNNKKQVNEFNKMWNSANEIVDTYGDAFDYGHLFLPFIRDIMFNGIKLCKYNNGKGLFKIWDKHVNPVLKYYLDKKKEMLRVNNEVNSHVYDSNSDTNNSNKSSIKFNIYNNNNTKTTYFDYALDNDKYIPTDDEIISDGYGIIEGKVTSSALRCSWGIYLLALFPETYAELKDELFNVFPDRLFTFKHINKCVLLKSFIYEVVRTGSNYRLSFGRVVKKTNGIKFNINNKEYTLPKNTIVKINKCWNDRSNNYFEYPRTVYLKHHYYVDDNNKKVFRRHKHFSSFGTGIRDCPGQTVVTREMQILYSSLILLGYKFKLTDNDPRKELLLLPPIKRELHVFKFSDVTSASLLVIKE